MESSYRPEIDGLRSIAVAAVIVYHAEFAIGPHILLPGGFLGVDVFFVISGFLITSLIATEYARSSGFSIANFYERRARRLLPALLTILLACIPFAWRELSAEQLVDFARSLIASLLFASNFYWHTTLQDYWAESALSKPLLHTWSLAVEEQYYLVFPPLLAAIHRFAPRRVSAFLAAGLLLSFLFAEWETAANPSFSFYMLPSRFWELLAGGLLAVTRIRHSEWRGARWGRAMPALGLGLVLVSFQALDASAHHPGHATLIPVAGTAAILWFASERDPVTRILSSAPFVFVGLISYSLYLWHYPAFAFARAGGSSLTDFDKLARIAVIALLSIASYYAVERPFRRRGAITRRTLIGAVAAASSAVVLLGVSAIGARGFPSRFPAILANLDANATRVKLCTNPLACTFNASAAKTVYLVGDSMMIALEPPLLEFAQQRGYRLVAMASRACPYVRGLDYVTSDTLRPLWGCTVEFQESRRALLLSDGPGIVIVGGRLPQLLSETGFDNREGGAEPARTTSFQYRDHSLLTPEDRRRALSLAFANSVLELARHGHHVVLVYPIPEVGWSVPDRLRTALRGVPPTGVREFLERSPITTSYAVYRERVTDSVTLLDGLDHPNIARVYPDRLFCNAAIPDRCVTHDSVNSFYRDDHHLSDAGARMLVDQITALPEFARRDPRRRGASAPAREGGSRGRRARRKAESAVRSARSRLPRSTHATVRALPLTINAAARSPSLARKPRSTITPRERLRALAEGAVGNRYCFHPAAIPDRRSRRPATRPTG